MGSNFQRLPLHKKSRYMKPASSNNFWFLLRKTKMRSGIFFKNKYRGLTKMLNNVYKNFCSHFAAVLSVCFVRASAIIKGFPRTLQLNAHAIAVQVSLAASPNNSSIGAACEFYLVVSFGDSLTPRQLVLRHRGAGLADCATQPRLD